MGIYTTYANTLTTIQYPILSGQSETALINCAELSTPTLNGTGTLRRISLPTGFPAGSISIQFVDDPTLTNFAPWKMFDGLNKVPFSMPADGGLEGVTFPAWFFDSLAYFKVISSVPMGSNLTIGLSYQPLYQGTA